MPTVAVGFVEGIALRYVRLRDHEGNMQAVPNGMITSVVNMSCGFAQRVVDVGVAHRGDVDETLVAMREVRTTPRADPAFEHRVLDEVEIVGVERRDDTVVTLRSRFQAVPIRQWAVCRGYLRRLEQVLDERGIEMPCPQPTVNAGAAEDGWASPFRLRSAAAGS